MPDIIGNDEAREIAIQRGRAIKETKRPDTKLVLRINNINKIF
jgi:hypothetical protein